MTTVVCWRSSFGAAGAVAIAGLIGPPSESFGCVAFNFALAAAAACACARALSPAFALSARSVSLLRGCALCFARRSFLAAWRAALASITIQQFFVSFADGAACPGIGSGGYCVFKIACKSCRRPRGNDERNGSDIFQHGHNSILKSSGHERCSCPYVYPPNHVGRANQRVQCL